ncbi:MAG: hypothetical protein Q8M79_04520, partial [Dehalococcoidia bacterium]|nr:hypothetical protein [Dehalococcoidia bacterium]
MSGRVRALALVAVLVAALGGGVLSGIALGERASRPGAQLLTLDDPRGTEAGVSTPLRSTAGFTGFEGRPALGGVVARVGAVGDVEARSLAVVDGGGTLAISLTEPLRLYRLGPATQPLAAGDIVLLRLDADGAPVAALRVPADLYEGDSRGETIRARQEAEAAEAAASPSPSPT